MIPRTLALCLALAALPAGAAAQDKDKPKRLPGDEMIEKYLAAETDKLSRKFMDGAKTLEEWQKIRPRLYREYMDMLGLWPIPEKTPLKATVTGTVARDGVVIEKIHFQSKPGLYVTANLYRPRDVKGKLPAVLYLCGHSGRGRDGNKTAFQDHGMWFASNGYVCILLDTLQLGEIPGVHHGTYGRPYNHLKSYGIKDKNQLENRFWWMAAGYTPAGVECWNGVRAIDYLVSRPDVDADKIAVTGISGGGAATFWVAAADERVMCAVPVSGMSDLESYVKNKVINGHCDCMFLINTYGWEWTTIAALVAPRPMLFANSDKDPIFPMDGNRRIMAWLRMAYTMYGKPDLVDEYVSTGGHDYRPDLRVAIFRFINKYVKGDVKSPVKDSAEFKPLPGKELRVFPTDADIPKDAINMTVDETFVPRAQGKLPEKDKFAAWKRALIDELQQRSLRSLAHELPPAKPGKKEFLLDGKPTWAAVVTTEPGIQVEGTEVLRKGRIQRLHILGQGALRDAGNKAVHEFLPASENLWLLSPRGLGTTCQWTEKSPPNYVERAHALLGQTVDEGRVRDVLASARYLLGKEKEGITLVGIGPDGILAAYAALFEPSIKEVIILNPPQSHKEGPYFLNVLRILDIPEVLGLLAPNVRLTLVNARDPVFDRVEEIYRLAGAADKLTRK